MDAFMAVEPGKKANILSGLSLLLAYPIQRGKQDQSCTANLMKPIIDARLPAMKDPDFTQPPRPLRLDQNRECWLNWYELDPSQAEVLHVGKCAVRELRLCWVTLETVHMQSGDKLLC